MLGLRCPNTQSPLGFCFASYSVKALSVLLVLLLASQAIAHEEGSQIDLLNVAADDQYFLRSNSSSASFGSRLSAAGDLNGDGLDDFIIGQTGSSYPWNRGAYYVAFGSPTISSVEERVVVPYRSVPPSVGFWIGSEDSRYRFGGTVAAAGDLNHDGYDDIAFSVTPINIFAADNEVEALVYVLFGGPNVRSSSNVSIDLFDSSQGVAIMDPGVGLAFARIAAAGDHNGDGIADLMISAPSAGPADGSGDQDAAENGAVYIVFGRSDLATNAPDLSALDGVNGYSIEGANSNSVLGAVLAGGRDVNADGIDDIVVSNDIDNTPASVGETYVIFGGSDVGQNGVVESASLTGTAGFSIQASTTEAALVDINADGVADVLIALNRRLEILYGGPNIGSSGTIDFSNATLETGFAISNIGHTWSMTSIGDWNGDGYEDLATGNWRGGGTEEPGGYIVYGGLNPGARGVRNAPDFTESEAVQLHAATDSRFRLSYNSSFNTNNYINFHVAALGDINGDGSIDLGAQPRHVRIGSIQGAVVIKLGGHFANEENTVLGTTGDDVLSGTDSNDIIDGRGGSDRVWESEGNDNVTLSGGTGQMNYLGVRGGYTFTSNSDGTVSVLKPEGGVDTLSGVTGVWFNEERAWYAINRLIDQDPPPPTGGDSRIVATTAQEILWGTAANDTFVFAAGTSTTQALDTIKSWAPGDTIDLTAIGASADDIETRIVAGGTVLKLIEDFGPNDFQLKISLGGNNSQEVIDSITVQGGSNSGGNVISASTQTDFLVGTNAVDRFVFGAGSSTTGAIDTVLGWAPGDIIDLTALRLSAGDIETKTVAGGAILKIIEGFGAGDFQLKVHLNGYSVDEVMGTVLGLGN